MYVDKEDWSFFGSICVVFTRVFTCVRVRSRVFIRVYVYSDKLKSCQVPSFRSQRTFGKGRSPREAEQFR